MRPRQACLGIPRKTFDQVRAVPRFNEAEASLPRNTGKGPSGEVGHFLASMRPRQACLGIRCESDPTARRKYFLLQ